MKTLSLLIKPASGSCNLRCKYCFYADVTDLRAVKNFGVMSLDTLEALVRAAFSEASELCSIGFQGGEPTLAGLDYFRALMKLEKKYNVKGIKVSHSIQSNGLLLNEEWAEFLADNKFLVGLSIDAGKSVHDDLRVDTHGKGTHTKCLKSARLLEKHDVQFNILSVVSKKLAAHPDEVWRFYKQHSFRHLQFIPCLDGLNDTSCKSSFSLDAKIYGKFLCRIFDLWYDSLINGEYVSVRSFDNYVHMLAGLPPENCAMSGICQAYALVEADGSVYPCDFYAVDEYRMGSIHTKSFEQMLSGRIAEDFVSPSRQVDSSCGVCEYFFLCRGGCRRDREPITNGRLSINRYCEAYKKFFPYALPRMMRIGKSYSIK